MRPDLRLTLSSLLLLPLLLSCGKKEEVAAPTPPVVLVTKAGEKDVPVFGEAVATLDGSTNTNIRAQVSGYLIKQAYNEGSLVKQGDLLFEIDPRPFLADLAKAEADLAQAKAKQLKTQQDYDRNKLLIEADAVSQKDLQTSQQTNEAAIAGVQAAQANLETAQLNLDYTKITSPISGIAGKAMVNLGDLVGPSSQLTTVSALHPIKAEFTVSEQFYVQNADELNAMYKKPMDQRPERLELMLSDGKTYPYKGKFDYIDRQINTSTGAITIYALFPNPDGVLRPGQYARIRAVVNTLDKAVVIPQRAVNEIQGLYQIVVIKDGNIADIRQVTVGDRTGTDWVITSGLKAGETVVVEGIQKCRPGATVTPQPWENDNAQSPNDKKEEPKEKESTSKSESAPA